MKQIGLKEKQIFHIPKDIFCEKHKGSKITWINVNQQCDRDNRLYCELCERPSNQLIIEYADIFYILKERLNEGIFFEFLFREFQMVETIVQSQIKHLQTELEDLQIALSALPLSQTLSQFIFIFESFKYTDLIDLSEQLAKEIIIENLHIQLRSSGINFNGDQQKNIVQRITALQNCSLDIARIQNQDLKVPFNYLSENKINTDEKYIKYRKLFNIIIPNRVTAILSHNCYFAVAQTNSLDNSSQIQVFNIANEQSQIIRNAHPNKIALLNYFGDDFFSVDLNQQIKFWVSKDLIFSLGKVIQADVPDIIRCIKFIDVRCFLAIGSNNLSLWKLNNTNECNDIRTFSVPTESYILCLSIREKSLISGDSKGQIMVLNYINNAEGWKKQFLLSISQASIFSLHFTSETDFISVSRDNKYTSYYYDVEKDEYEYKQEEIEAMNNITHWSGVQMIKPVHMKDDNQDEVIQSDFYSFHNTDYFLASVRNNILSIFQKRYF